jgi:putative glycerol-1-phosphate prenyltransferase
MLVDGGRPTAVSYMSNTHPLPANKPSIAATTALAGVQLGLRHIYMDAGSGADRPVPGALIQAVREEVDVPIWVGGGIRSAADVRAAVQAGANVIVIGTALEEDGRRLKELSQAIHLPTEGGITVS